MAARGPWAAELPYRDLRHGDRDVLRLDGELDALPQVGGEALGLVRPLTPVLARASGRG